MVGNEVTNVFPELFPFKDDDIGSKADDEPSYPLHSTNIRIEYVRVSILPDAFLSQWVLLQQQILGLKREL